MTMSSTETIPAWLSVHAESQPEHEALVARAGVTSSYRSLAERAAGIVDLLVQHQISSEARVAVVMAASANAVVALLGTIAHCTCAPLNPALTEHEYEFELEDLGIVAILVEEGQSTAAIAVARRRGVAIVTLPADPDARAPTGGARRFVVPPERVAIVLHTSGTTAKPKIVPLTHEMLARSAASVVEALTLVPADRYLGIMPLYHIHGLATLFGAVAAGCTVIAPRGFEPSQFWDIVRHTDPTWYSAAPTIHQGILRASAELAQTPRARLRFVRSASAALPISTIEQLERLFGVPVVEFYGMTEASDQICTNPRPPGVRKPGSVGRPVPGIELTLSESGEILIRGKAIIREYENNPVANSASFVDGWFRTGDLGHRDADDYVYLTGRAKEIINRGGEKISPREIDEVLMRHPGVHQAVAFAIPHPTLGEAVGAAIVLKPGGSVAADELRRFASQYLAEFKIPQEVVFADTLPKGATGKLQRIGLAKHFAAQLARRANDVGLGDDDLPRGETERAIAAAWRSILKLEQVARTDNFFALGGDSLLATMMVSRASQQLGAMVTPEMVFAHPRLASWLRGSTSIAHTAETPLQAEGSHRVLRARVHFPRRTSRRACG
jgi:acyl-CoA synthetase (AMP-forming)/AMP-acid ligase II